MEITTLRSGTPEWDAHYAKLSRSKLLDRIGELESNEAQLHAALNRGDCVHCEVVRDAAGELVQRIEWLESKHEGIEERLANLLDSVRDDPRPGKPFQRALACARHARNVLENVIEVPERLAKTG